jgi:O-6-methylguanine DNA methyltransferase
VKSTSDSSAERLPLRYAQMDSPIGPLTLVKSALGLCHIEFGAFSDREAWLRDWAGRRVREAEGWLEDESALADELLQLREYFEGTRREFALALDPRGTPFQLAVWSALRNVPYGETRSYADIASAVGNPRAVRAVGGANNKNPLPIVIPCHRIIGSDGSPVGYGGGLDRKAYLLELEAGRYKH